MCLSCGCGIPYWDHDNQDNITLGDLRDAMVAGNVSSLKDVVKNIKKTYKDYNKGDIENLFGPPPDKNDDDDSSDNNY